MRRSAKGYTVGMIRGSWVARVWQPASRTYRSRTFPSKADGERWARTEAARLLAGVIGEQTKAEGTATLAKDYLAALDARGRAISHQHDVRTVLARLAPVAPDLGSPRAPALIERWLDGLDVSAATRNRYLVTVRGLCRWAIRRRRLISDPTAWIDRAQVPQYLRPQFTVDELRLLLNDEDDHFRLRFAVLLYAGLRVGEADLLWWEDVDWSGQVLALRMRSGRIKRQRERLIPLQDELGTILRAMKPQDASGPILSPATVTMHGKAFGRFLRRHGLPEGRTPHSCRHTYAGLMVATGEPTSLVGSYLGHTSAATTMGYTKLAARYVAAVRDWPRGQFRLLDQGPML